MAKNVTISSSPSRGIKMLAQAFSSAASEIPEATRADTIKGALKLIRDQIKDAKEKVVAAKKKNAATSKNVAPKKRVVKLKAKPASAKTTAPKKAAAKSDKKLSMAA
jgi:hypothetical protein